MAYFSSLQNFIDTITTRFNKPRRSLNNEGLLKQDIVEALSDVGKYADDVREECQSLNTSLITRSLSITATIYLDGISGDDSRTGTSNDTNSATGRVKTLQRVAQLHNFKTPELTIILVGALTTSIEVTLEIPVVNIIVSAPLNFSKRTVTNSGIIVGEGTNSISFRSTEVNIRINSPVTVEGHTGSSGNGNQSYYQFAQGALKLLPNAELGNPYRYALLNIAGSNTITLGNNTVWAVPGSTGTNSYSWNTLARYRRSAINGGAVILGTNAIETLMQGDRCLIRSYTPSNSTDVNVSDGELVADTNYLYRKSGSTIKKIAWSSF
ncbi:hypothetical protein CLV98_1464 [Dyadobacter jejuensis]|uniref:Uncharacterized protein n=1 Tax=Dyadobacter jejuensis TaxID=1082580 RepID=A0A315ZVE7_9BACT|nr:hypothetical protein [Dyadobacter jejuensis]PWJ49591.1 hypothetical protein CLV98_1464 [Dyadobacter jejuensis]